MSSFCTIHQEYMTERQSKTKFTKDGEPIIYYAHSGPDGKLCFGEGMGKAERNGRGESYQKFVEKGEALKRGSGIGQQAAFGEGMKKKDWNMKTFKDAFVRMSYDFRKDGQHPYEVWKTTHLKEWMYVTYGDEEGFEEFAKGITLRANKLMEKEKVTEEQINALAEEGFGG